MEALFLSFLYAISPVLAEQANSTKSTGMVHGGDYYTIPLGSQSQNGVEVSTGTFDPFEGVFYGYNEQNGLFIRSDKDGFQILDTLDAGLLTQVRIQFISDSERVLFVDAGLGRVFVYDLKDSTLTRIDNSYDFRAFYSFSGFVDEGFNVFSMGGYGEFRHKNTHLRFDSQRGQWEELATGGRVPEPDEMGFIFEVNEITNTAYFVVTNKGAIRIYVLDRASFEWKFKGTFDVVLPPNEMGYYLNYFTNHKQIGSLLHIRGNIFYDYIKNEINIWKGGFDKIAGIYSTSETSDSLYCIHSKSGRGTSIYSHDLVVERLPMEPFLVESNFESIRPRHQVLWTYGIMLFIALAGVLTVVLIVRSPRELRLKRSTPITFHADRVELNSKYVSEKVLFFDELDIIFWKYMQQILEQNIQKISLEELDDTLFKGLANPTQRSSKRAKLISRINKELGYTFLTIERAESDKRRKLINIDWDVLL